MSDDADTTREDAIHALKRRFQDLERQIEQRVDDDGLAADGLPCLDDCIDAVEALVKWYEAQTPDDLPLHGNAHHIYYIMHAIDGIRDWTATFLSREFADELDQQLTEISQMADELDRTVGKAFVVEESEHHVRSEHRELPEEVYDTIDQQLTNFASGLSYLATRLSRLRKWAERSRDPNNSKSAPPPAISSPGPSVVSGGSKPPTGEGKWGPGAKEKLEKGIEGDREKRQQQWKEWLQQRIQLEGEIEEARQAGDVSALLSKLAEGIASWAVALKSGVLGYFDDTDDGIFSRRMSASDGPLRPGFILWPFAGAPEGYDLIELTVGEDQARAMGRRVNDLEKQRQTFADAVAELGSRWDGADRKDWDTWDVVDRQRSQLKQAAFDVCRYVESLIRLIDSGKVGPSSQHPPPNASLALPKASPKAPCIPASGMLWQEAQEKAEKHIKAHNGEFSSVNRLAKIVGCSRRTMDKAIARSRYLTARRKECDHPASPREVPLNDAILDDEAMKQSEAEQLSELIDQQKSDAARDERQAKVAKHRRG